MDNVSLTIMLAGFSSMSAFMIVILSTVNKRFDSIENRMDKMDEKLSNRIEKLDEKLTDVDRRLCRLEGAFSSKDCCMIKEDRNLRAVE